MSYAVETEDRYSFDLSASATEKCKSRTATREQDSNALFFQIMCVLYGDGYAEPNDGTLIPDLSDAIFYMDFDRVFDRSTANKKQRVRQEKARAMFRPEGVGLDFGSGPYWYVAFERSGSMSRQARLSFIRADLYDAVRRRVMLGMDIDQCQLSKLYAYNGLMLSSGTRTITDLWGVEHRVKDVDVILTRSMCKGLGWMAECVMSWDDYWDTFRRYRHALYITNVSKERPEQFTELNYQFLTTVSVRADEFRPADLPDGWNRSPKEDKRHWLTKQTELAYYNFRANEQFRRDYFLRALEGRRFWEREKSRDYYLATVLKKNPRFISEPAYTQMLDDMAERIVKNYAVGRLIVNGDNRYLSGDLLDLLVGLLDFGQVRTKRERTFYASAFTNVHHFPNGAFYAPGADYDGDMVKTIADPIINAYNENPDDEERQRCREETELLGGIVKPVAAVRYVVALGRRGLLWELLPDAVLPNVLEVRHAE